MYIRLGLYVYMSPLSRIYVSDSMYIGLPFSLFACSDDGGIGKGE